MTISRIATFMIWASLQPSCQELRAYKGEPTATAVDSASDSASSSASMDSETESTLSVEIEWVALPSGFFSMGTSKWSTQGSLPHAVPVHDVNIPSFEIMRTEVVESQWVVCMDAGVCGAPLRSNENFGDASRSNHAVSGVTWTDAVSFCAWVGGQLPSEAQWEYAARSCGEDRSYPWGESQPTCEYAVMYVLYEGWGEPACGKKDWPLVSCTRPAGNTKQGLCDMIGNVMEWTADTYHDTYIGAPNDHSAWEDGGDLDRRMVRDGGLYADAPAHLDVHWRWFGYVKAENPDKLTSPVLGLRCVR